MTFFNRRRWSLVILTLALGSASAFGMGKPHSPNVPSPGATAAPSLPSVPSAPIHLPPSSESCCARVWGLSDRSHHSTRGTGYYPDSSAMEGGYVDRQGKPLRTLQSFLKGNAEYVSTAMDSKILPYGTKICIPELNDRYGANIRFKVVDTGGAFMGKGMSRIDICTGGASASLDSAINSKFTLIVCQ